MELRRYGEAGIRLMLVFALAGVGACVPYAVGSTAAPVPAGDWTSSGISYFIPGGLEAERDSTDDRVTLFGYDQEFRYGIDERSDIGIRIPGFMGVIGTWKRMLGPETDHGMNVAVMLGGGFINAFEHAHVEATLIMSAPERQEFVVYGGARLMQVMPMNDDAVSDSPTAGVFLGVRIGRLNRTVAPELGVFYDRSALGLRSRRIIFVPSINIQSAELLRGIFRNLR